MKKILQPWLWLAIVPLIFVSCEDDESEVIASSQTIALLSTSSTIMEGGSADFSVIYLGTPDQQTSDITVNYEITGDPDGTYTGSVVIPAGEQSAEFSVTIPEDNMLDPDTTDVVFTLTGASGGFLINENTPQNTQDMILLEDTKNISVTNDTISISEAFSMSGDTLFIPVNLSNSLDGEVTLGYTLTGSATPGADYMLLSDNPLVVPANSASAKIAIKILDDIITEDPARTLYIELDDIVLSDTDDEETSLLEGNSNRVIAYNIEDDVKSFGFDAAPTDTIVVSSPGSVTTSISATGTLVNGTTLSFTNNLPTGVTLNASTSTVGFSPAEASRTIEFNVAASAFTGTDVTGTYIISGINASGDQESVISGTNNTIVIKIVN